MRENEKELEIDIGIITIKYEEYSAITSRLEQFGNCSRLNKDKHQYIHQSLTDKNGFQHNVAVARCLEPGTGNAQSLAADMIEELNPTWLFLVGIAGGIPAPEFSLGDVLLCTRIHDFSVCCIQENALPTFAISGGPMHQAAEKLLEVLPAYENHLEAHGWNSVTGLHLERPTIDLNSLSFTKNLYGDESWNEKVTDSLKQNFSIPRKPKYYLGPIGSSDGLVKSVSLVKIWMTSVRNLAAVEMELAGVYLAAQKRNIPVLTIRSLSDIVGYKRSPEWTQFACESAASFAICLIEAGILTACTGSDDLSKKTISMIPSVETRITQENGYLSLPLDSPFHPFGTIPLNHQTYITRDSDTQLKKLLSSCPFICLHGDFCSGKSSLLLRVPKMLSEGWSVFRPRLDLYPNGRKGTLEKNFFAELRGENQEIRDWVSLGKFLNGTRGVFLIDEIGKCTAQDASMLIEKLYALVDHVSYNNVRVVLTIQKSLDLYIENIGLKNPKYYNCWEKVELTEFNNNELIKLLDIFPQPIERSLQENLDAIQKCTLMKPSEVQKFCDGLWKYLKREKVPIEEIDHKVKYYIENF
jgi:nucleoside phosphorylase